MPAAPTAQRIAAVAAALRASLLPLVTALAGDPPRPSRLVRAAGLDKSIASRLVQAVRAETDADLLHRLPSPAGLRLLLDGAARAPLGAALREHAARAEHAADAFQRLIDTLPGGRQALDARLGAQSDAVRQKREHMARQAAFKAQSFLFGHYCDTLTTTLFVLPSATPGQVDFIEVHRRIGLRRVTPGAAVPLFSVRPTTAGATGENAAHTAAMASLEGDTGAHDAADFVIAQASSAPLPAMVIEHEGAQHTFIMAGDAAAPQPGSGPGVDGAPMRLTTAYRLLRVTTQVRAAPHLLLRNYMLHLPCATLVRDVYLADGLWPDARPELVFQLPSPMGMASPSLVPGEPQYPYYRELHLSARVEQRPPGGRGYDLPGVPDQRATLETVLARAGAQPERFRGWRCDMAYPLPLVEMRLILRFGGAAAPM